MKKIFFAFPGNEKLAGSLALNCSAELGTAIIRKFPDGESYIRITTDVKDKHIFIICTLSAPDDKILPLLFFCKIAKELGVKQITLVAPYLAYMRQDTKFRDGEGITAVHFAQLVSSLIDSLITIDPHLHRIHALSEIYSVPVNVLHASDLISAWIKEKIKNPVIIGPDQESEQWVSAIANESGAPYLILNKTRRGDTDVEIITPDTHKYMNYSPVLADDIISTASTMISTVRQLAAAGLAKPICIGVHGIFAGNALEDLKTAGAGQIVTCNTILHPTNRIQGN
jgi:ribose-phosphate pyrophosphokinase